MRIKWLGQSCFMITSDSGTKIITDPYKIERGLRWSRIEESADIVTVSHEHFDHNNISAVQGNPKVVRETVQVKGIKFRAIPTYHDNAKGSQMGNNTVFCFEVDGVNVCHAGDLGHMLSDAEVAEIGKVDVLLVPTGGTYTIDAKTATKIYEEIGPSVVIPMHFSCEKLISDVIASIDGFIQGKKNVIRLDSSEIEFKSGDLPASTEIILLKSAK